MDVKILPYIDPGRLNRVQSMGNPVPQESSAQIQSAPGTARTSLSEFTKDGTIPGQKKQSSFQMTLASAQRTLEALTVDLVASQDQETIERAAQILSSSKSVQLQNLGKSLINTGAGTGTPITGSEAASSGTSSTFSGAASSGSNISSSGTAAAATNPASATNESSAIAGTDSAAANGTDPVSSCSRSEAAIKAASVLGCPASLEPYFIEASEEYGVDIALLEAIAKAESDFKTDAVSSAGAAGVMQLMPGTAESQGVTDRFDARQNILGGAKLIAVHLKQYDGDLSLALAAYNAGPGNVKKYGGIPPFKETTTYVKRVTGYYNDARL